MKEMSSTEAAVNLQQHLTYTPITLLCSEGDSFSLSDANTAARFAAKAREAAQRRKVGHNMLPLHSLPWSLPKWSCNALHYTLSSSASLARSLPTTSLLSLS